MKQICFAIIILLGTAMACHGATNVTFAWDASSSADVTGYRVYQSTISGSYNKATGKVCDVGATILTCTVTGLPDNQTFYFVATAYDASGNESAYSNQVSATTADTQPPSPPSNLRRVIQIVINWIMKILRG